ncbi:23S rRNA (adenine(2503)-C(2))-methyltransferase RlmN [Pelosinus propionicus]|uniref:Probable dual-specificity RNA methyltransferase RlmN n=1 Tax=Pelosinus propionicus DSM 13327 TaxID=1123291 RepID=A0A1I4L9M8_9FIRM|nr:23S rRNA (adenine(2503)-C(2))-methyltransferase RlmN [Pelosinus propionicus]SFL87347.1 23S rRNA (adenine2503-C2)-methyltransferase [Pelosinus propionicus DSM 13327]
MSNNIFGMFIEEIAAVVHPYGLPKYSAGQIAKWMYQDGVYDFKDMTNISKKHRALLTEHFVIHSVTARAVEQSSDGKTSKYLLEFHDGMAVETVLMRQHYGNSVCISTQVGCAMGCVFCASTLNGVSRNLTGGEMLAQVLFINKVLQQEGSAVNTIVIMGSGEPLANYDNVLNFIKLCHAEYSLHLSYRGITLSTSGLVPEINRLAAEGLPLTLSISLHASNNELRSLLMPINNRYSLPEVMAAGDFYAEQTGRRVTYEYILIADLNDKIEHAKELAILMRGRLANVNLIPVNPVIERGLLRPDSKTIQHFEKILLERRINVTVRREMGTDIRAACGQLRNKVLNDN